MISCFKGKIYAHKVAGMILKSKSDYLVNAFALILSVGCIPCSVDSDNRCIEYTLPAMRLLSWLVLIGVQIRLLLNLLSIFSKEKFRLTKPPG
ncbi:MAG: hypothetical protein ACJAYB_002291 [Psychromonas sp.]|jgi:hypothetical protein